MILQEGFQESGYTDLLDTSAASKFDIGLEHIVDPEEQHDELLHVYISEQGDELFLVLDGDSMEIDALCDRWDNNLRVGSIINRDKAAFKKLKFNIVQLIVYSGKILDKSRETDLIISRKMFIQGDTRNKDRIVIDEKMANGLPFRLIQANPFAPDAVRTQQLHQLLPKDKDLQKLMKKKILRKNRREKDGGLVKSLEKTEYNMIKEWLEK